MGFVQKLFISFIIPSYCCRTGFSTIFIRGNQQIWKVERFKIVAVVYVEIQKKRNALIQIATQKDVTETICDPLAYMRFCLQNLKNLNILLQSRGRVQHRRWISDIFWSGRERRGRRASVLANDSGETERGHVRRDGKSSQPKQPNLRACYVMTVSLAEATHTKSLTTLYNISVLWEN